MENKIKWNHGGWVEGFETEGGALGGAMGENTGRTVSGMMTTGRRTTRLKRRAAGRGFDGMDGVGERERAMAGKGKGKGGLTEEERLLWSAQTGDQAGVRRAVSVGADVEARDWGLLTALMLASFYGRKECLDELLGAGASHGVADGRGKSPLMMAAWQGHADCVGLLLRAGADPNWRDKEGRTVAMEAAMGRTDTACRVMAALIGGGADVDVRDSAGQTAETLAMRYGTAESAGVLVSSREARELAASTVRGVGGKMGPRI